MQNENKELPYVTLTGEEYAELMHNINKYKDLIKTNNLHGSWETCPNTRARYYHMESCFGKCEFCIQCNGTGQVFLENGLLK